VVLVTWARHAWAWKPAPPVGTGVAARPVVRLSCALLCAVAGLALTVSAQPPARPPAVAREVPTERASNVFFARASVNGRGPFWFTVDTGATLTVLDPSLANTLHLPVQDSGRRAAPGVGANAESLATTRGVTITVGEERPFAPARLYVIPVAGDAGVLGHRIDGVLGTDFLRRRVVEIDYPRSRVVLHDPVRFSDAGPGARMRVTIDGNLLLAPAVLTLADGDVIHARLLVDTGSNSRLSLNSPFVRQHRLAERFPSAGMTATLGINGLVASPVIRLRSLALGAVVFDRPEVALSRVAKGLNAGDEFDGIVTADLLHAFRMVIDYPAGSLILERGP
jgi:predicted aspartyl protease